MEGSSDYDDFHEVLEAVMVDLAKLKAVLTAEYDRLYRAHAVDNAKRLIADHFNLMSSTPTSTNLVLQIDWKPIVNHLISILGFVGPSNTKNEFYSRSLEAVAEFAYGHREQHLIRMAADGLRQAYFKRTEAQHLMSSPAKWLEMLTWLRGELILLGKRCDSLLITNDEETDPSRSPSMVSTKLLLPISGCLLGRLEELIAQNGFTSPSFLATIPPQIELILNQILSAIQSDMQIDNQQPQSTTMKMMPLSHSSILILGQMHKTMEKSPLNDAIAFNLSKQQGDSKSGTLNSENENGPVINDENVIDFPRFSIFDMDDFEEIQLQSIAYLQKYQTCGGRNRRNRRDRCQHLLHPFSNLSLAPPASVRKIVGNDAEATTTVEYSENLSDLSQMTVQTQQEDCDHQRPSPSCPFEGCEDSEDSGHESVSFNDSSSNGHGGCPFGDELFHIMD